MENERPRIAPIAVRYGIITGIIMIIYTLILYFTDQFMNKMLASLSFLILIGGIIMAFREYKRQDQGFMTYGQGLSLGMLTSVVAGVLVSIFQYIYMKFIDDTIMQRVMDNQMEEMEKMGMSEEEIERGMEMASKFTSTEMVLVSGPLSYLIGGLLISLVVAAFMRNARPEFE
jgi:hypothetical protein